jgi:hypothetical protein
VRGLHSMHGRWQLQESGGESGALFGLKGSGGPHVPGVRRWCCDERSRFWLREWLCRACAYTRC